jgi:uncharacterized Tic20 family protein
MSVDNTILQYLINFIGGVIIGAPILGQLIINAGLAKIEKEDSQKSKLKKQLIRIFFAIISFGILIIIMRIIRSSGEVPLIGTLSIALGVLSTVYFGRKLLIPRRE